MASYIPSTMSARQEMLDTLGVKNIDELFAHVPQDVMLKELNIPHGQPELAVRRQMETMAEKNVIFKHIFRGAGAYNHYIPSVAKSVTQKETFVTAYTPYQAEISQGTLQSIFEYQTMICRLTGMDVSNASVYDGATASAEALNMCRERKRQKVYVSATSHPEYVETMKTYCFSYNAEMVIVPQKDGKTDADALASMLDDTSACFYVQQPNYYGIMEDGTKLGEITHNAGAKYIMCCNPFAMTLFKSPAECGADIAVGEGQPLGLPLSFGGPYLGFMAATNAMLRKLPGRIVGQTVDLDGKRAFVLTLQAREQHIRREKASSNICSNQALCALVVGSYMASMGKSGMMEVAKQCMAKAKYAADTICGIEGFSLKYNQRFFHEFYTTSPIDPVELNARLEKHGILGGYPVGDGLLWCVTELISKDEIDTLAEILRRECVK